MVEPKSNDICQVRCFNVELVAQVNEALPGDDLLEDAQILFGDESRSLAPEDSLCSEPG